MTTFLLFAALGFTALGVLLAVISAVDEARDWPDYGLRALLVALVFMLAATLSQAVQVLTSHV